MYCMLLLAVAALHAITSVAIIYTSLYIQLIVMIHRSVGMHEPIAITILINGLGYFYVE